MISIEYYKEGEYLDAVGEYFPEARATLKFDTEDCTLTDLMQGMVDIARFASYHVDENVLKQAFENLMSNF